MCIIMIRWSWRFTDWMMCNKHAVLYYTWPSIICYTVRIKIKVIHIQRPIVPKSIDLKICMWHISKEQLIFPLVPFLHQVCTHDWVHCHWRWQCHDPLFASFRNWDGRLQWMLVLAIQMDECLVIHMSHWNCILKVWVIIASYQDLFW